MRFLWNTNYTLKLNTDHFETYSTNNTNPFK